ncbi:hypothetical protein WS67_21610 [Burkholderia singularis]|uniref:UPF0261 protein WS67_21610 n=1 Tax=Burkholderia singularis TaxID=1503053 RepID=A0A118DLS3_9BURK|nr:MULTISPECIES: Tm-1-like ATP-binding domain-containing protein [Burkholderia]AOK32132.1 hypothetical protein AQ611_21985 [Burkholderia sp. Bp7605]KVE23824.1 hypothetical protein WS67_21610 [Burkholderia singularis]
MVTHRKLIYVAATVDTKGAEAHFVKSRIAEAGLAAQVVDLSTRGLPGLAADVSAETLAAHHPDGTAAVFCGDRGRAIAAMAVAFERYIASRDDVAALIGIGGSGGTALIAPALQALPVGVPKLMISTMASGDVSQYVGASDIAMLYSVTDVAGLNRISRQVLANGAHMIAGAVRDLQPPSADLKPAVGLTMFGVTTPCIQAVTAQLDARFDCLVFHATGSGGRSMEKLADSRLLDGVLDLTTTEVCDLLMGGILACGEDRFDAIARSQVPYVGACGALDMVNFARIETVPPRYADRLLYRHNPQITLMRTTPDENRRIGEWIGTKLNACDGPVRFLIPEGGVSALDAPGQPFWHPEADAALFAALEATVKQTGQRRLVRVPAHINDPLFAAAAVEHFLSIYPATAAHRN